ncbi:ABC transporter ATP-binding protein [Dermabacteraceae bacterium P13095]
MALVDCREAVFLRGHGGAGFRLGPVSFTAEAGQVWALIGANGAGKSTLFQLLTGGLRPSSGQVTVDPSLSFLPQGVSIPGRLTVTQMLRYMALLEGVKGARRRRRAVAHVLDLVRLGEKADAKVATLSGGQHRRLLIAQALLSDPRVLLLDEPTAGLDIDQRGTLREIILGASRQRTTFVSSHIVEDLAGVADHVLHLQEGRQKYAGDVAGYLAPLGEAADHSAVDSWVRAYSHWNEAL